MSPVLVASGIGFRIGSANLVHDASLSLFSGELTVIVGPNGAGKSTMLKLLTGELRASAGVIHYGPAMIAQLPAWRLACQRAVMAQTVRLAFPFTVYDVVRLGVDGVGRAQGREAIHRMVAEALSSANVTYLAARSYQTLSGGEQQRVQFARVLGQLQAGSSMADRQVLFLDEPIASLDLCHQFDLLDTAKRQAVAGAAVLAVLHDINLAITYADRLVVMKDGMIVAQGAPADVVSSDLLRDVFQVKLPVERLHGMPYILPQSRCSDGNIQSRGAAA